MATYKSLPPDVKRLLYQYADLPARTIESLCRKNKEIYQTLCQNKSFWISLARRRLSSYINFDDMTINEIRKRLIEVEESLPDVQSYLTGEYLSPSQAIELMKEYVKRGYDIVIKDLLELIINDQRLNLKISRLLLLLIAAISENDLNMVETIYPRYLTAITVPQQHGNLLVLLDNAHNADDNLIYYLVNNHPGEITEGIATELVLIGAERNDRKMVEDFLPYITSRDTDLLNRMMYESRRLPGKEIDNLIKAHMSSLPAEEIDEDFDGEPIYD